MRNCFNPGKGTGHSEPLFRHVAENYHAMRQNPPNKSFSISYLLSFWHLPCLNCNSFSSCQAYFYLLFCILFLYLMDRVRETKQKEKQMRGYKVGLSGMKTSESTRRTRGVKEMCCQDVGQDTVFVMCHCFQNHRPLSTIDENLHTPI